ncbi:MAG: hypothetical protein LBN22_08120 [Clostridiales Family XIII bacterium]|jgi:hypothetical protein|nr:hypothetical protein [Clostridiales Family XIII bacterium]
MRTNKKKRWVIISVAVGVVVFAILAMITTVVGIHGTFTNVIVGGNIGNGAAEKTAKKYLAALADADYEIAYKLSNVDSSKEQLSKTHYASAMRDLYSGKKFSNYDVVKSAYDDKIFEATYTLGGESASDTMLIKMIGSKNYKIDMKDSITTFDLIAPAQSKVLIDGIMAKEIKLSNDEKLSSSTYYIPATYATWSQYELSPIFKSSHKIMIESESYERMEIDIDANEVLEETPVYDIKKEIVDEVFAQAELDIKKIVDGAFAQIGQESLGLVYADNKWSESNVVNEYNELKTALKYENDAQYSEGYSRFVIKSVTDATDNTMWDSIGNIAKNNDKAYICTTELMIDFTHQLSYETELYTATQPVTVQMVYLKENGKWKLAQIESMYSIGSIEYHSRAN